MSVVLQRCALGDAVVLLLICALFEVVQPVALRWHSWVVALPLLGSVAGTAVGGV